jgi:hypothetical protein
VIAAIAITQTKMRCRWDLVKRIPQDLLDYLTDRAKASAVDDNAMRSQYTACQEWLRYSPTLFVENIRGIQGRNSHMLC